MEPQCLEEVLAAAEEIGVAPGRLALAAAELHDALVLPIAPEVEQRHLARLTEVAGEPLPHQSRRGSRVSHRRVTLAAAALTFGLFSTGGLAAAGLIEPVPRSIVEFVADAVGLGDGDSASGDRGDVRVLPGPTPSDDDTPTRLTSSGATGTAWPPIDDDPLDRDTAGTTPGPAGAGREPTVSGGIDETSAGTVDSGSVTRRNDSGPKPKSESNSPAVGTPQGGGSDPSPGTPPVHVQGNGNGNPDPGTPPGQAQGDGNPDASTPPGQSHGGGNPDASIPPGQANGIGNGGTPPGQANGNGHGNGNGGGQRADGVAAGGGL